MTYATALTSGGRSWRWLFQPGERPFVSATRAGQVFALLNVAVTFAANLLAGENDFARGVTFSSAAGALAFAPIVETMLLGLVVGAASFVPVPLLLPLAAGGLAGFAHHRGTVASFAAPALCFALLSIQFRAWLAPNRDYMVAGLGVAWTHFIVNAVLLSLVALFASA